MRRYLDVHRRSLRDPEGFWAELAQDIDWQAPWDRVIDHGAGPGPRWYPGGRLNTCYNALDRHLASGRGDQAALIYDSPLTGNKRRYSYQELTDTVARFAGALRQLGVEKGDRVLIYMPMIPEVAIAMLACARLGAIHSVVFGGFAAKELATRIDDALPKLIIGASCGIEPGRIIDYLPLINEALEIARHAPCACIMKQRPEHPASLPGWGLDWDTLMATAEVVDCVPVAAGDPLYILYTSGTTGQPKGVVRDNGGHAVALHWTMKNIYACEAGDVFWAASDVGWVVGHSYIVYGPLLAGCTTLMYEGKPVATPDPGAFWRIVSEYRVKALFTAPTAFRAIRKEDPQGRYIDRYDTRTLKALFLAGERCDPDTLAWAQEKLGIPVIDHWWQTETGWAVAANPIGLQMLPVKPGSPTLPMPGYDVRILDPDGSEVAAGQMADIVIRLPLPPGCLTTLWNNDAGFNATYLSQHPGYYLTGDAGYRDEDGYLWIMSRIDDVINICGHRLSTGAIEEVLAGHPEVAECAVIGVADDLKGQQALGLVVLNAGSDYDHEQLVAELILRVRQHIGPVAAFKKVLVVTRLPKTRSGKVLRGTMAKIADGRAWRPPATIDDPQILNEITAALKTLGHAGG